MNKFIALIFILSAPTFAEISDLNINKISRVTSDIIIDKSQIEMKNLDEENPMTGGFNDLVPYILPSPHQQGAGSCLYMSHTGIIEWWINKLDERTGSDRIDLSERYYMSLKTEKVGNENVENWRTDNIERLNATGIFYKNEDYRYTKGWYKKVDGKRVVSHEDDKKAKYGTRYNWISFRSDLNQSKAIKVPKFKRNVILKDQGRDQWNVGQAPNDIADKVKEALVTNRAPVLVIYNHQGFWHANIVFGFNDNASSNNCPFTSSFKPYMDERALEMEEEAKEAKTPSKKKKLLAKAKNFRMRGDAVQKRYDEIGGCSGKGVFYVRDSIFPDESMPIYDYDFTQEGEEQHLNSPLIVREYEWLTTSANHIIQILPVK